MRSRSFFFEMTFGGLHPIGAAFLFLRHSQQKEKRMATNNIQTAERALSSEATEMRRDVGLFGGISVLAGIMIGSGIFYRERH